MSDLAYNLREKAEILSTIFNNRVDKISRTKELLKYANDRKLFNGDYLAIGIDGSIDYEEQREMLLLYVNAIAYSTRFKIDTNIEFEDREE